jgi:hypothetical protein
MGASVAQAQQGRLNQLQARLEGSVRDIAQMSQLPGAASSEADSAIMQTLNPLADQGVAVGILKISATNVVILSPVRVCFPERWCRFESWTFL